MVFSRLWFRSSIWFQIDEDLDPRVVWPRLRSGESQEYYSRPITINHWSWIPRFESSHIQKAFKWGLLEARYQSSKVLTHLGLRSHHPDLPIICWRDENGLAISINQLTPTSSQYHPQTLLETLTFKFTIAVDIGLWHGRWVVNGININLMRSNLPVWTPTGYSALKDGVPQEGETHIDWLRSRGKYSCAWWTCHELERNDRQNSREEKSLTSSPSYPSVEKFPSGSVPSISICADQNHPDVEVPTTLPSTLENVDLKHTSNLCPIPPVSWR